jgi:CelD/BcsL family acetyltransferase involved in cellulose biosynthesis
MENRPGVPARAGEEAGGFASVSWAWHQLRESARYFFQTPEWVALLAERLDDDLAWSTVRDGSQATAVSVLRRSPRRVGGVELKVLTEIRVGEGSGSPFSDALTDNQAPEGPQLDDLLSASGRWHVLQLKGLRAGSPWLHLGAGNGHSAPEPDGGVGVLDTQQRFDDLWRAVPKNMRNATRKAQRRVTEAGGADVTISTGPEMAAACDRHGSMEASGWKGKDGTPLAQTPVLPDYLLASGGAQARELHIGKRLAASQLTVTVAGTLFLLKVAYDEQLADLSPGNILMANLVEACCEDPAIDRIDCIVWQPWHQRWGMAREPTYQLVAFNRSSLLGAVAGAAWTARRRLMARRAARQPAPSHSP